jgi:hypothetical protein
MIIPRLIALASLATAALRPPTAVAAAAEIAGVSVIPHRIETAMRYRKPHDPDLAARMQLFVKGPARPQTFDGRTPAELLASGDWAWHDLATAEPAPEGALSVWTFNGKSSRWGVGHSFDLKADGLLETSVDIAAPTLWISAATFLSSNGAVQPDTLVLHAANDSEKPLHLTAVRLWLPKVGESWTTLWPQKPLTLSTTVPPKDRGFAKLTTPLLPLTYAAIEVTTSAGPLWAHLRIKREAFDISGGWVGDHVKNEPFLRLLSRLHVNTAHIEKVNGYTDNPTLYDRWPLKLFNTLEPATFDTDEWLPKLHAVEFLGEPQYGGGRPVPPQEVFDKLLPYRRSRLPSSVTHSEERIWRWYAGLSDFPHYDAYRVVAPSPDSWSQYDRWGKRRIRWGAPLETIGDMCRSLRDLNRPMPCAYWSQGPHHGWSGGFLETRKRRSPTPDELRLQAYHALASRITSLYWFNLSLPSLVAFPDLIEPMTRVGREIRMLDDYYLEGDATSYQRILRDGAPDWDLNVVAGPRGAVLFALDLAYEPDPEENTFKFGPPRTATFRFPLPSWLQKPVDVFRIDADGITAVDYTVGDGAVTIHDTTHRVALYMAPAIPGEKVRLESRRQSLIAAETATAFDPGNKPEDLATLKTLMPVKRK